MKKLKSILLLALCLAMVVTTITIPEDNIISPYEHYLGNTDEK